MALAFRSRLSTLSRACLFLLAAASPAASLESATTDARTADEAGLAPRELLGKRIFEDKRLSEPQGLSCASCHDPAKAFQGNNGSPIAALARGSRPDALGTRKTPTLSYASFSPRFHFMKKKDEETGETELVPVGGQFWDGRANDLVAQVEGPLLNPREMNNPSKAVVVEKIGTGPYADLARRVYGEKIFESDSAFEKLARAVAAYESSARFHPFSSKFDDFLRGREKLTAEEARGFALFKDKKKGNCLACHVGEETSRRPQDWLFTDFSYDALGAPRNLAIPDNKDADHVDLGLCKREGLAKIAPKNYAIDGLCGQFKAPTLRNIAVTGPYLHNGVFSSLRDVVAFYATRDTDPARWYPKKAGAIDKYDDLPEKFHDNVNVKEVPYDRKPGETPRLDDGEIDAIVAFLHTLTDRPAHAGRAEK
ncbi:c-type cytochrome [Methylosinus sp. H3A]|uniref:cytochrome-c peroxidase n=1 Tax=Methylosinus sp. H3A TaxID=2785786 RepID=UPI0018C2DE3C|nr:cytochrome c peroxidase [Methylosinus sp. H3A]MBG0810153.1 c-type cytochrome [Methylosinus sp. H3A]